MDNTLSLSLAPVPAQPAVAEPISPPAVLLSRILTGSNENWPHSRNDPEKPARPATDDAVAAVAMAVNRTHHLLYVELMDACYVQAPNSTYLYTRLEPSQIRRWVVDFWKGGTFIMGAPSPKKIKDSIEMVKSYTEATTPNISRRYISITPTLFWDADTASLTDAPESPCFFRLFDTPTPTQHFLAIPPFTPEQVSTLHAQYQRDLEYIADHNGDLPETYPFITLWADHNHDVYMDIIRAAASPFFRVKPFGAFMLCGVSRTGKTNFSNDLMKTMLGTANCSEVTMANIGNPRQNNALEWTLYNAPDEEDEQMTEHVALFKTITDHGRVPLDKLYSSAPVQVDCNFPCVFPMNHKPIWGGVGANACITRSLIIEFTHVFDEDKSPVKFTERTFTPDMFSHLLGTLFAIATYYRTHEYDLSPTMLTQQDELKQDVESHSQYYEHFIAFFDGFQSIDQLYDDYKLWCQARGLKVSSKAAFKMPFGRFTNTKYRKIRACKKEAMGYRIPQPGKKPLINQANYPLVGVPKDLWEGDVPCSVVTRKEWVLQQEFPDAYEGELRAMISVAKKSLSGERIEDDAEAPEQPPLPIDNGDPFAEGKYD